MMMIHTYMGQSVVGYANALGPDTAIVPSSTPESPDDASSTRSRAPNEGCLP